jgi:hypothetical protein
MADLFCQRLKWYWWRFNANGYFYGMLFGVHRISTGIIRSGIHNFLLTELECCISFQSSL